MHFPPILAEQEVNPSSGPRSALSPIRVLHIEDDWSVARAIARLLRLNGYEVVSAATREELLRNFKVEGWQPDIILADYQLSGGNTSEILIAEVASRIGSKPPTIVLAGTMEPQGRRACEAYADRVLYKPADMKVLLRELDSLLKNKAES
jgi:CheY-like chemotaxis protein